MSGGEHKGTRGKMVLWYYLQLQEQDQVRQVRRHPDYYPLTMQMNNNIIPNSRDVLNGRGQGVQRHPGNVKYRKLVFVNKVRVLKGPVNPPSPEDKADITA
eukprot:scaffold94674_cov40-Cyclotella_meneghiniana.AAC.1